MVHVKSFFLVYEAVKTPINDQLGVAGVYGKGHLGVSFLRGSMCAEEVGCERRWLSCVLWGIGTTRGHLGVV